MFLRVLRLGLGLTIAIASVGAADAGDRSDPQCRVAGADALPKSSGGASALCSAVERAVSVNFPGQSHRVEVRVRTHHLEALVTTQNGKVLPTVQFAQFDRAIDGKTFERFASAVADHIAAHQDRTAAPIHKAE
jgi:hypothetical protein